MADAGGRRRRGRSLVASGLLALGLALAGCMPFGGPGPTPSGVFALHTVDVTGMLCPDVGLFDTILTGSATDPRVAWLHNPGGDRPVEFPAGFSARFTPDLEVLDAGGRVAFVDGQRIDGGCVGPGDAILLGWP